MQVGECMKMVVFVFTWRGMLSLCPPLCHPSQKTRKPISTQLLILGETETVGPTTIAAQNDTGLFTYM